MRLRKWTRKLDSLSYILKEMTISRLHETVYFYTFHKCASTLFSKFVLKKDRHLCLVDYGRQIYRGNPVELQFKSKGYLYGPIRIFQDASHPGSVLVRAATRPDFVRNKKIICLVRDPRDILVSAYYSFGYTHRLVRSPEARAYQIARREEIQNLSIDEYVLKYAEAQRENFRVIQTILAMTDRGVLLRYEDMIDNFPKFIRGLNIHLTLSNGVNSEIYRRTRPKEKEDRQSHQRSGKPGNFRRHLQPATIDGLDQVLGDGLDEFGYQR